MADRGIPRPDDTGPAVGPTRRQVLTSGVAVVGLTGAGIAAAGGATADSSRLVLFRGWKTSQFTQGSFSGTRVSGAGVAMSSSAPGLRRYTDPGGATRLYESASWTSPTVSSPFPWTDAIASWNADTPDGTWIEVRVAGWSSTGESSGWLVVGRWASKDPALGSVIHRRSVAGQSTNVALVEVDTVRARGWQLLTRWAVQVVFCRVQGSTATPTLRQVGVMTSRLPVGGTVAVSPPGVARGITLGVPTLSQELHRGHYPQWDGGGEAWCSATSMAMVLRWWQTGPSVTDAGWVQPATDPWVDYAARMVYDYDYEGCGNWPFNTAYATRYGLEAFVTRLRSLSEAELFIKARIPLVVSVSFSRSELPSAGYATSGHLMVICGFTASGDVVVNDPASHLVPSDSSVRTVYPRAQFENVWIPKSGGTAYVVRHPSFPLPTPPASPNWPAA